MENICDFLADGWKEMLCKEGDLKKAERMYEEIHPDLEEELNPVEDGEGEGDRTPAEDSEPF
jgi:hypothetical protein